MTHDELVEHLREMPVGSWLRAGYGLAYRVSGLSWRFVSLENSKENNGSDRTAHLILSGEKLAVKDKIKNPTGNPNPWAGPVDKPAFDMKVLKTQTEMPVQKPTYSEVSLKSPPYLEPIVKLIHACKYDQTGVNRYMVEDAVNCVGRLLKLLYDYQRVIERMPDWVFTDQKPRQEAVATGSSSVWPIDADRKYASNPIDANENRKTLADFICERLGYSTPTNYDEQRVCNLISKLAYEGAAAVGQGPPDADMHGRTCGEAVLRNIIEGLLKELGY